MLAEARFAPSTPTAARPGAGPGPEQPAASPTPTIDQYGNHLTAAARGGRLDPVIGRADEIEQAIEVLSRRTKNNPVLIGEAGVGKTAIVEGIAQRIVDGDVPDTLIGRRVVELQLSGVVAGTRYRGDFEERMRTLIEEIRTHSAEADRVHIGPGRRVDVGVADGELSLQVRDAAPGGDREEAHVG